MFSAILTVALVLGSPEPRRYADAYIVTRADLSAAEVHRQINRRQVGNVLSFGVMEDFADAETRWTLLKLLIPVSCDTTWDYYRLGMDLSGGDVREVIWKRHPRVEW
jgi:hypothetical protein